MTTKSGTETYVAGEDGSYTLFVDDRDDITISIISNSMLTFIFMGCMFAFFSQ